MSPVSLPLVVFLAAAALVQTTQADITRYKMDHASRGYCILINNFKFQPHTTMPLRIGTFIDKENLSRHFKDLRFEVQSYTDVSKAKFQRIMSQMQGNNHDNADAFALIILSHGDEHGIWMTDDKITTTQIFSYFKGDNCPGLKGKPKLFFIQACRGTDYDSGTHTIVKRAPDPIIPYEADFMVAYSTVPGYFSWRNGQRGSWFGQAIGRVLESYSQSLDLLTCMTRAAYIVANNYESSTDFKSTNGMKQQLQIISTLLKDVHLKRSRISTEV